MYHYIELKNLRNLLLGLYLRFHLENPSNKRHKTSCDVVLTRSVDKLLEFFDLPDDLGSRNVDLSFFANAIVQSRFFSNSMIDKFFSMSRQSTKPHTKLNKDLAHLLYRMRNQQKGFVSTDKIIPNVSSEIKHFEKSVSFSDIVNQLKIYGDNQSLGESALCRSYSDGETSGMFTHDQGTQEEFESLLKAATFYLENGCITPHTCESTIARSIRTISFGRRFQLNIQKLVTQIEAEYESALAGHKKKVVKDMVKTMILSESEETDPKSTVVKTKNSKKSKFGSGKNSQYLKLWLDSIRENNPSNWEDANRETILRWKPNFASTVLAQDENVREEKFCVMLDDRNFSDEKLHFRLKLQAIDCTEPVENAKGSTFDFTLAGGSIAGKGTCLAVKFNKNKFVFDAGFSANAGIDSPLYLITHGHIDHVGSLASILRQSRNIKKTTIKIQDANAEALESALTCLTQLNGSSFECNYWYPFVIMNTNIIIMYNNYIRIFIASL